MNHIRFIRFIIVSTFLVFSSLAFGADIWSLAAYLECLEQVRDPLAQRSMPSDSQDIKKLNAVQCDKEIEMYRSALGKINTRNDRCFTHGSSPSKRVPYVIADADDILAACKSTMSGSNVTTAASKLSNTDPADLKKVFKEIFPEKTNVDEYTEKYIDGWNKLYKTKIQQMTRLVKLHDLESLGWWITYSKYNGRYLYEEYNIRLKEE